ncbi:MAG: flippase [Opitutus sp.]|nr:flippase [Opitutus sp.]
MASLTGADAELIVRRMQQTDEVLAKPGLQRAAANLGWLFAERGVRLALSVGVGFLVARHLGPGRLGVLSYCLALTTLASAIGSLGLDAIVKRDLLLTPERTAEILASGAVLRFAAGAALALLTLGFVLAGAHGSGMERRLLAVLAVTLLQPAFLVPELWLQARLLAKYSVWSQTGALVVSAALRVVLIAMDAPLAAFAATVVVEMALAAMGFHLLARRAGLRFRWSAARRTEMRRLLGEAWPLVFAGVAVMVYMKIDEVMLRHLVGPEAVGIYSAATRLTEIWFFVPTALASSVLPALLRARDRGEAAYRERLQQYFDLSAAAAYALSVPMALAAPWIVRLAYGAEFAAVGPILAVHVWSSVFVFLGVARGQWLVNEGLQKFYLAATSAGAVANIALNLVFIPQWGGLGAAWATVVSYALAAWLASYFHRDVRGTAAMQTRALLIPMLGWRYLRRA